jgi:hypothetical protein
MSAGDGGGAGNQAPAPPHRNRRGELNDSSGIVDRIVFTGNRKGDALDCSGTLSTMKSWRDLSSAEVVDYFEKLELGQYVSSIASRDIDGRQLTVMTKKQLVKDLKLSKKDARTVRLFIEKDWYPPSKCKSVVALESLA